MQYDFIRYLAAKKPIDDRSLNHAVYQSLSRRIGQRQPIDHPLRVIEIGAGIGTMLERLLDRQLWQSGHYTALDWSEANLQEAARRMAHWAAMRKIACQLQGDGTFLIGNQHRTTTVEFRQANVTDFFKPGRAAAKWDLLIAHAFLDLVDMTETLALAKTKLQSGALLYLTLNFDGETILLPRVDPHFDSKVIDAYHRTMDERCIDGRPSGHSRTGRRLFEGLNAIGASIIRAGSSDWVVHPAKGSYTDEERYFLHYIIQTIYTALEDVPELDQMRLSNWRAERLRQIEQAELVYIARQLDFLAQV